jgi:hypothetical protein
LLLENMFQQEKVFGCNLIMHIFVTNSIVPWC